MTTKKRARRWRELDTSLPKEQAKYELPIPSREFILSYLETQGVPITREEFYETWNIVDDWEREALRRRFKAMERDGQLIRNRRSGYGVATKMNLIKGRVVGHPDGYGFLTPDDGSEDLYISPRQMRQLLHGDRIMVRIAGIDHRGRRESAVVEILERGTERVVGRLFQERGIIFVVPDNKRIHHDILVPPEYLGTAQAGQIVIVELISQPSKQAPPIGRVKEVLGEHMAPGMEVQIAIARHEIPTEWPAAALEEAQQFSSQVPENAKQTRMDLRELPLVTIDGIDARDFDDAVYCEQRGKNWRLIVAIADVAWYVRPHTALDEEAHLRGNSVYLPDRVIPMLPETLSNGLCSLNPHVDRLCMACEMTINPEGRIVRSRFMEAVMRSQARLTYDAVAAMLVDKNPDICAQYQSLLPHLQALYQLYQVLHSAREKRGALDLDTQETAIEYSADRKIERIVPVQRNAAHRLIEECMLSANVAAARFLQRHRMPTLYRVHEGPTQEKLARLKGFLGELGLGIGGGDKPSPKDYATLLKRSLGRSDFHLIQTVILRSLSQAVYSPEKRGHFGLALEAYTHFTSPIRRYPDLLVHRAIRHILHGGSSKDYNPTLQTLSGLGEHCSMTERRADEAVWDAVEWLKCEFMLDKIGEVFDGLVTAVTGFGLFVELQGVFVEGLVHVTALHNDYYHFDPVGHRLRGERSGQVYRLGDNIRVRIMRVDLDERKIDFELANGQKSMPTKRNRRRSRKKTTNARSH
jgi:ribonuclease R